MCVCVCVLCACVCVRMCVCVSLCMCVCARVCVCVLGGWPAILRDCLEVLACNEPSRMKTSTDIQEAIQIPSSK